MCSGRKRDISIVGDDAAKCQWVLVSGKISKGHLIELMSDITFDEDGKD